MNSEEIMRAAGGKPLEAEAGEEQKRIMRELEARLHGLAMRELQADIHNTKALIKGLRVDIDRSIKNTQALAALLNRGDGGRNVALAITHLEDAKMRLGLALGDLGHKLPEEYRDEAK